MGLEFAVDLPVSGLEAFRVSVFGRVTLGPWRQRYAPLTPSSEVRLCAEIPSAYPAREGVLDEVRECLGSTLRIDGRRPLAAWLVRAELHFQREGALSYGELTVEAQLPEAVAFPFTPGQVSPPRPEDVTFEEALREAFAAVQLPVVAAEIVETERYWLLPVRQIGTLGTIVDRRTGRATAMGSALSRDTWVWAWEAGLTESQEVGYVVESCADPALLRSRLGRFYRLGEGDLQLPLRLGPDWRALEVFHALRDQVRVRADR